MWSVSLFSTTISINFEIKDRFETGRKFSMTFLSKDGFLSNGVTRAAFIFVGTIPVDMDSLTMFVMLGRMQSKCAFSIHVGTGSSEHDFEGLLATSNFTSYSVDCLLVNNDYDVCHNNCLNRHALFLSCC